MVDYHPWIDTSRAPIYVLTFPEDKDDLLAGVASYRWAFQRFWNEVDRRVAVVTDLSHLGPAPAALRKLAADVDNSLRAKQQEHLVVWGVVLAHSFQRLILQGYLWMAPPVAPYCVFDKVEKAIDWTRVQLASDEERVKESLWRLRSARNLADSVNKRTRGR